MALWDMATKVADGAQLDSRAVQPRTPRPNPKPETRENPKPETNPETRHPRPETRNPKPGTRNPKPETLNPRLET